MAHSDRVRRCFLSLALFTFLLALAANVTPVAYLDAMAHQSDVVVSKPERREMRLAGTPHDPIVIDGDANFSDTVLLEGWPGDGSPENPYIIDGLDIDLGGAAGDCISISNTRISFIIRNCNLTGAGYWGPDEWDWDLGERAGIYLENITNGELVNNICNSNGRGISIESSNSITVFNNTCNSNGWGIWLSDSDSSTVVSNTCNGNRADGISLPDGSFNTVSDNTCNDNEWGIWQVGSHYNTVVNNTCSNNVFVGIDVIESNSNTVSDNTCNGNDIGINLDTSYFNNV
ncbi:MAG: right-handed parallel beta-helix repeat-containing protein, partial [Candidatus Thorarchaeota archaeon]